MSSPWINMEQVNRPDVTEYVTYSQGNRLEIFWDENSGPENEGWCTRCIEGCTCHELNECQCDSHKVTIHDLPTKGRQDSSLSTLRKNALAEVRRWVK